MADSVVTALREAAAHRGFRLLASRVRTPGKGDYGKFGLMDRKGKPVLGVDEEGLSATADEIEAFLRRSEIDYWKRSAAAPGPKPAKRSKAAPDPVVEPEPAGMARRAKIPEDRPRAERPVPVAIGRERRVPNPEPPLRYRLAKAGDAAGLATLLGLEGKAGSEIAGRIAACRKAGGGVLLAERGVPVGCLAWFPVPALHRAPAGRIATLLVAGRHRREGIGTALVEQAAGLLAKAGCASIEAMSDIDIRSAHDFFRKLGFDETSYRFARSLDKGRTI